MFALWQMFSPLPWWSLKDARKETRIFWTKLFELEEPDANNVLPIGPLIHRHNEPSEIHDLFVRDCYAELYEDRIRSPTVRCTFFTGTPGLGISVFRSYAVWRQIQDAKENKTSCLICLCKSPLHSSPMHLLVMKDGSSTSMCL